MSTKDNDPDMHVDWENRILCGDESCIGVIGKDGCCNECGKAFEGQLPDSFNELDPDSDSQAMPLADDQDAPEPESFLSAGEQNDDQAFDDEWDNRKLCSDESCIGVIGKDRRCKECGKPYAG